MNNAIQEQVARLGRTLKERGLMLATAESCTGGLVSSTCTDVSGSSDWFKGAVVAYANEVKEAVLGVAASDIAGHGAVSEPVVLAMARGVRRAMDAEVSVSISGIAGPTGGTPEKPVGTVWMGFDGPFGHLARRFLFKGDRGEVKAATVRAAIETLIELLENQGPGE